MKLIQNIAAVLFVSVLMITLPACEEEGPVEEVGEEVDDAVEETGDAIEEATDEDD